MKRDKNKVASIWVVPETFGLTMVTYAADGKNLGAFTGLSKSEVKRYIKENPTRSVQWEK